MKTSSVETRNRTTMQIRQKMDHEGVLITKMGYQGFPKYLIREKILKKINIDATIKINTWDVTQVNFNHQGRNLHKILNYSIFNQNKLFSESENES